MKNSNVTIIINFEKMGHHADKKLEMPFGAYVGFARDYDQYFRQYFIMYIRLNISGRGDRISVPSKHLNLENERLENLHRFRILLPVTSNNHCARRKSSQRARVLQYHLASSAG